MNICCGAAYDESVDVVKEGIDVIAFEECRDDECHDIGDPVHRVNVLSLNAVPRCILQLTKTCRYRNNWPWHWWGQLLFIYCILHRVA
ncbi:hypothetical protein D3C73_1480470 [compost metagenome]